MEIVGLSNMFTDSEEANKRRRRRFMEVPADGTLGEPDRRYFALRLTLIGDFSLTGGFFSAWTSSRSASSRLWRK